MPDRIQNTTIAPPFDYGSPVYDSSTTTVRLGESSLSDIARIRNIDPKALLAQNPQISDLYAPLVVGQEVHLPFCQAPAAPEPAPAAQPSNSGSSPVSGGDPLAKSVVQANIKNKPELTPDEVRIKEMYGDEFLRTYKDMKSEFAEARQTYLKTGKIPPLKHHAPIEIMSGKWMTRSERYDANLVHQGKDPSYPKMDVDADPVYLTREEFREEWKNRGAKEMQACDDNYIRPGKKEKCRIEVKEKYMSKEYMEASWAATRAAWNDGAYIESIKNAGPVGLGGRVIGRSIGYAIDGKEGADKGEQIGGLIGDMGDVGIAIKSGANARARLNAYEGSGGLEVRRDAPVEVTGAPPPATAETRPNLPTVSKPPAAVPEEALWLSHGTDTPGLRQMGGLGTGQIRVDHSPGAHQDFGQGFYVAVGEGPGGFGIAEAAGDLRTAQRGTGPRQVLAWQVKRSDLGDVVDVRPGGQHAEAWKKYLEQPLSEGTKMTVGDYIRGTGVERRGEYFDKFLKSIGKQNADVVLGPIGTPETSGGAAPHQGTQMVIRSQRVADRLNQMMGASSGPNPPSGKPDPTARPTGEPTPVSGDAETRRGLTRENESAQILAQNGYRVVQNPKGVHSISNPDYQIEGRPFDSYAPSANKSARGIWSYIREEKLDKIQTSRVVLNLKDWNGDINALKKQFADWPLPGLDEMLVITKDGKVTNLGQK